jgi:uncharacterized membrane protein (DUF441 family)
MFDWLTLLVDRSPMIRFGIIIFTIAVVVMISTGNLVLDISKNARKPTYNTRTHQRLKNNLRLLYDSVNRIIFVGGWILIGISVLTIAIGLPQGDIE